MVTVKLVINFVLIYMNFRTLKKSLEKFYLIIFIFIKYLKCYLLSLFSICEIFSMQKTQGILIF